MRPPLHLRLQTSFLLTLLTQPLLQLLLLLPHTLNTALQLQHTPLALDGKVCQAGSVSLTLAENLIHLQKIKNILNEKIYLIVTFFLNCQNPNLSFMKS